MTTASPDVPALAALADAPAAPRATSVEPRLSRALQPGMLLWILAAAVAGFLVTPSDATTQAVAASGEDLAHLLRAMAALKALMAAGAGAALLWRLGTPVAAARLAVYAVAAGAMAAGPGVIWGMAYVKLGALLLHAGLAVLVVALWGDPAVAQRLDGLLRRRA